MNCFQKLVSLLFETTFLYSSILSFGLWIAFKNLYLCSLKQPLFAIYELLQCCELLSKTCIFALWNNSLQLWITEQNSCELLSKTCIFALWNNLPADTIRNWIVVNCFQKLVSLLFETTQDSVSIQPGPLWIAFKNLYLCSLKQRGWNGWMYAHCCELLSKTCIFALWNNIILALSL